jgi:hypothetical protein
LLLSSTRRRTILAAYIGFRAEFAFRISGRA